MCLCLLLPSLDWQSQLLRQLCWAQQARHFAAGHHSAAPRPMTGCLAGRGAEPGQAGHLALRHQQRPLHRDTFVFKRSGLRDVCCTPVDHAMQERLRPLFNLQGACSEPLTVICQPDHDQRSHTRWRSWPALAGVRGMHGVTVVHRNAEH